MSNPNILIKNTVKKISLLSDKTTKEKPQKCVCCLTNIAPFVNLTNCRHTSFLQYVYKCYNFHTNLVCRFCHAQLKKIARFQHQVATSAIILNQKAGNVKTNYPRLVQSALQIFSTKVQPSEALILSPINDISDQCEESIIKAERDSSTESNQSEEERDSSTESIQSEEFIIKAERDSSTESIQSEEFIIKAERDSSRECSPEAEVPLPELKWIESNVRAPHLNFLRINGIPRARDKDIKIEKEVVIESTPDADTTSASINKPWEKMLIVTLSEKEMEAERERDRARPVFSERTFKCTKCIVGFDYETFFIQHNEKRHAVIHGYTCKICDSVFAKRDQYSRHYKMHFIRHQCGLCGLRLLNYHSMVQHISRNHEDSGLTYKCSDCDYVTKSDRSLRNHRSKHKTRPICAQCGQSFVNRDVLKSHKITVHTESPKIPCSLCPKVFKSRFGMLSHRRSRHNESNDDDDVPYCQPCNVFFKSQLSYNAHLKMSSKHVTEDDKRFKCDQCEAKFVIKSQLQKHVEFVHFGIMRFKCDECDKAFRDKRRLKTHKTYIHEKRQQPRSYICDHCGKGFTTTQILASHIRTHTGERPFICTYCNATFGHKAALYTHTKLLHKRTKK